MSVPQIRATQLADGGAGAPVIIAGPSLGTSAAALWSGAAQALDGFTVIGWDLPGHGAAPAAGEGFTMAELAEAVAAFVRAARTAGDLEAEAPLYYAGVSIGGAVGLQLGVDHPDLFNALAIVCSGAKIGEPDAWRERAATVSGQGTPAVLVGSAQRWFAPGFIERAPEASARLLHSLQDADRFSYAYCCEALADFDVRDRLPGITVPVLAVAGAEDQATPPASSAFIAEHVADGRTVVVADAAHLVPAEKPAEAARLLSDFFTAAEGTSKTVSGNLSAAAAKTQQQVYDEGMAVRREVLGDAHVDRANAGKDAFTEDFQDMITRYAWGTIWTRPGLPRTMRSAITLTALVAHGHLEELAMHVRAALRNGLTRDEIKEVLLQSAIYCSVPSANSAFKTAQRVFAEIDAAEADAAEADAAGR